MSEVKMKKCLDETSKIASALAGEKEKRTKILTAISEKRAELIGLGDSDTQTLIERKEDLAASLIIGAAEPESIEEVDMALAESRSKDEYRKEIGSAIAGLERKLSEVEAEIRKTELNAKTEAMNYISAEAEVVGAQYLEAADKVMRLFRKFHALELVARAASGSHACFTHGTEIHGRFSLPAFRIDSHVGISDPFDPNTHSAANDIKNNVGRLLANDFENEKQRLAELGLFL